mgnify:CR=1 FL=1
MKDPAFLFYSSDFLSGTMLMSNEEVGIYIRLLCLQHQQGHLKEEDMIRIGVTKKIFSKFIKDNEGCYYNERLEYEVNKRKAYSESRRNNRKKKEGKETYVKDMKNICNSYEEHMENENININANIIKNRDRDKGGMGEEEEEKETEILDIWETQFNEFYSLYPKKVKKQEVKKWFQKNKPTNELFSSIMHSLEQFRASKDWQKDGGQFIPYPITWLNQKRWEDESVEITSTGNPFLDLLREEGKN